MGHQSPHYLKLKGKTYYFSRRVPKELQKHSKCSRFEVCLRTSVKSVAFKQSMLLAQELDDQWSIVRRRERNDRIARFLSSEVVSSFALNSEVAGDRYLHRDWMSTYSKPGLLYQSEAVIPPST